MAEKNNLSKLIPNSYLIKWDSSRLCELCINATKYNIQGKPISWAVQRYRSQSMSKLTGEFEHDPSPSNRSDEFIIEFRFDSAEEAYQSYLKFNKA